MTKEEKLVDELFKAEITTTDELKSTVLSKVFEYNITHQGSFPRLEWKYLMGNLAKQNALKHASVISAWVRDNVLLTLPGQCADCDAVWTYSVRNRQDAAAALNRFLKGHRRDQFNRPARCPDCSEKVAEKRAKYLQELAERERELQLEADRQLEARMNRDTQKRTVAIKERRWEKLTPFEFNILRRIIVISDLKELWSFVFNGNPYDKEIWSAFRTLEREGLITTQRGYKGKLLGVSWNNKLNEVIIEQDEYKIIQ